MKTKLLVVNVVYAVVYTKVKIYSVVHMKYMLLLLLLLSRFSHVRLCAKP